MDSIVERPGTDTSSVFMAVHLRAQWIGFEQCFVDNRIDPVHQSRVPPTEQYREAAGVVRCGVDADSVSAISGGFATALSALAYQRVGR